MYSGHLKGKHSRDSPRNRRAQSFSLWDPLGNLGSNFHSYFLLPPHHTSSSLPILPIPLSLLRPKIGLTGRRDWGVRAETPEGLGWGSCRQPFTPGVPCLPSLGPGSRCSPWQHRSSSCLPVSLSLSHSGDHIQRPFHWELPDFDSTLTPPLASVIHLGGGSPEAPKQLILPGPSQHLDTSAGA